MDTLRRINRVRTFVSFVNVSLEVANYVTRGQVARAMHDYIDSRPDTKPARIRVNSERGRPVR